MTSALLTVTLVQYYHTVCLLALSLTSYLQQPSQLFGVIQELGFSNGLIYRYCSLLERINLCICDHLLTGKKYTKPNETLDYPRRNMMNERIFDHGQINQKTN